MINILKVINIKEFYFYLKVNWKLLRIQRIDSIRFVFIKNYLGVV